jgi:hypothetical protein
MTLLFKSKSAYSILICKKKSNLRLISFEDELYHNYQNNLTIFQAKCGMTINVLTVPQLLRRLRSAAMLDMA